MKETELAACLINNLATYPEQEIYKEVACSGIIDIVLKSGKILTAIECKTSFGLAVIEQAVKNVTYAHYSYVAVPKLKGYTHFAQRICKQNGIGVFEINLQNERAEQLVPARLNRRIVAPKLHEFYKLNTAGVQFDRWTAWGWFVDDLKRQLERAPAGLTHKDLFDNCYRHYQTPSHLKSNVLVYIKRGHIKNVAFRDNRFFYAA